MGEGYTCISGSGVQRQMTSQSLKTRYVGIDIEMPPELLATFFPDEAVGVSDRTLRRGFKEMFGTTVFGYLTNIRME